MRARQATLLLRADADAQMGTGHVMRCLALAQAWQARGQQPVLATAATGTVLASRLQAEGIPLLAITAQAGSPADAEQTAAYAKQFEAAWVALDGYQFSGEYQRILKDAGPASLLSIDDFGHAGTYWADLVLNQNLHAGEELYRNRRSYSRLLLGPRYVLLRREFARWRGWKRTVTTNGRRVLISLGGADPANVSLKVLHALRAVKVDGLEPVVLVGGNNPHAAKLHAAAEAARVPVRFVTAATDMPEWLAWADLFIGAGGTTAWEGAFLGAPALLLVLADNQRLVAERLAAEGAAWNLGAAEWVDAARIADAVSTLLGSHCQRQAMAANGQQLVDGWGAVRILDYMLGAGIQLRPAAHGDSNLLWQWANEPQTRSMSFHPEPIPWDEHVAWLDAKLADPQCALFVAESNGGEPLGQVRFDIADREAVVSVTLDKAHRGNGLGTALIRLACERMLADAKVLRIHAYVKGQNTASQGAFSKAGFHQCDVAQVHGQAANHWILERKRA